MRYLVFLIILAFAAAPLHAKALAAPAAKKDSTAARRVLSFSQFVKEMVECTAAVYRLENADLQFNPETDREFHPQRDDSIYQDKFISAKVLVHSVHLQGAPIIFLSNFHFQKGIEIEDETKDVAENIWQFSNCIFYPIKVNQNESKESVLLSGGNSKNKWTFSRCRFVNGMDVRNCKLEFLSFHKCKFETESSMNFYDEEFSISVDISAIKNLFIQGCSFDYTAFSENTFTNVDIKNSTFKVLVFTSTILRKLTINNCKIDSVVEFYAAQFPHKSTALPFAQIAGKLAIEDSTAFYRARTDADFANEADYDNFIALYTDFLSLYKTRGDQESYNACYVEMKQIHTRRAGYLYRKSPALESWFDWRLNQLLEIFSDYGTNSAKGLIYIFYVIIGFAALYLIFPSEPDNLSRQTSFAFFDVVIGYFTTNTTLVNLRKHKRQRALDDLHNFQTTLAVSREDVPAFIAWLGKPLYGLNRAYLSVSAWLVERFDIVPGRWQELSKGRKLWTSVAVGAYMLGFLAWGVVMRCVNAFALSINAFVTLGYGEIQARGVARYLAVLEGAVGWFLLSIFSVTLISQLLQ
jgi:hypothetical protein